MKNALASAYNAERNAALLALDKDRITDLSRSMGVKLPDDEEKFWVGVHLSRTAIPSLGFKPRLISFRWLDQRGYASKDDGELSPMHQEFGINVKSIGPDSAPFDEPLWTRFDVISRSPTCRAIKRQSDAPGGFTFFMYASRSGRDQLPIQYPDGTTNVQEVAVHP